MSSMFSCQPGLHFRREEEDWLKATRPSKSELKPTTFMDIPIDLRFANMYCSDICTSTELYAT